MLILSICLLSGLATVIILVVEAAAARADRRMPRPPWQRGETARRRNGETATAK